MDTTDWLIAATAAGPFVGALVDRGLTNSLGRLAKARSQRVHHIPVSGTDLYHNGVPLTETQFREVFAAYQAELDELPPPAERSDWDMKRQFAAAQRLAVLTGTHPRAFPNVGDPDRAWECYTEMNPYSDSSPERDDPWTLEGLMWGRTPFGRRPRKAS
jgi:hypothetical protein